MEWIVYSAKWYITSFILSIVFFGLTKKVFSRFFDLGYAFARIIGLLFLSYGVFVLGILHISPLHPITLYGLLGLGAILGYILQKKEQKKIPWGFLLIEEFVFFSSFIFWTYVRSQEPSIISLEKLMDFGFINSILRSQSFPPLDMWYATSPINYYYFGHLSGAVQIRLAGVPPQVGYNLILATLFALSVTATLSLAANIIFSVSRNIRLSFIAGGIGSFILNLGGNLHTIYLFTSGYPADKPIPFWEIVSSFNPMKYWYPNATRFIPFTIHEFPAYSYVVADLHGHVFDIPFVLTTLAILFLVFLYHHSQHNKESMFDTFTIYIAILLGFLTAIHYMTNAFDGPIYLLLTTVIFFILFSFSTRFIYSIALLYGGFLFFSFPFSYFFKPFATGMGLNCSPGFLTTIGKIGPLLFEKGNCQPDPIWMLLVLWGFFWVSFLLFYFAKYRQKTKRAPADYFTVILFTFGSFLILVPELFYIKDIYPAHFRANTMFKLGYEAFIMMSIGSSYTLYTLIQMRQQSPIRSFFFRFVWFIPFLFVAIYSFFSIPAYYGGLRKAPQLDGTQWLTKQYPENAEIVAYINEQIQGQPVILEAQGDSYTNFNHISSYTGLPTVAGWWVHEWLWRGTPDAVGKRIPDVVRLYESDDIKETQVLIKKYNVSYVIITEMERQKYQKLNEKKFEIIGKKIFESKNGFGALYQVK